MSGARSSVQRMPQPMQDLSAPRVPLQQAEPPFRHAPPSHKGMVPTGPTSPLAPPPEYLQAPAHLTSAPPSYPGSAGEPPVAQQQMNNRSREHRPQSNPSRPPPQYLLGPVENSRMLASRRDGGGSEPLCKSSETCSGDHRPAVVPRTAHHAVPPPPPRAPLSLRGAGSDDLTTNTARFFAAVTANRAIFRYTVLCFIMNDDGLVLAGKPCGRCNDALRVPIQCGVRLTETPLEAARRKLWHDMGLHMDTCMDVVSLVTPAAASVFPCRAFRLEEAVAALQPPFELRQQEVDRDGQHFFPILFRITQPHVAVRLYLENPEDGGGTQTFLAAYWLEVRQLAERAPENKRDVMRRICPAVETCIRACILQRRRAGCPRVMPCAYPHKIREVNDAPQLGETCSSSSAAGDTTTVLRHLAPPPAAARPAPCARRSDLPPRAPQQSERHDQNQQQKQTPSKPPPAYPDAIPPYSPPLRASLPPQPPARAPAAEHDTDRRGSGGGGGSGGAASRTASPSIGPGDTNSSPQLALAQPPPQAVQPPPPYGAAAVKGEQQRRPPPPAYTLVAADADADAADAVPHETARLSPCGVTSQMTQEDAPRAENQAGEEPAESPGAEPHLCRTSPPIPAPFGAQQLYSVTCAAAHSSRSRSSSVEDEVELERFGRGRRRTRTRRAVAPASSPEQSHEAPEEGMPQKRQTSEVKTPRPPPYTEPIISLQNFAAERKAERVVAKDGPLGLRHRGGAREDSVRGPLHNEGGSGRDDDEARQMLSFPGTEQHLVSPTETTKNRPALPPPPSSSSSSSAAAAAAAGVGYDVEQSFMAQRPSKESGIIAMCTMSSGSGSRAYSKSSWRMNNVTSSSGSSRPPPPQYGMSSPAPDRESSVSPARTAAVRGVEALGTRRQKNNPAAAAAAAATMIAEPKSAPAREEHVWNSRKTTGRANSFSRLEQDSRRSSSRSRGKIRSSTISPRRQSSSSGCIIVRPPPPSIIHSCILLHYGMILSCDGTPNDFPFLPLKRPAMFGLPLFRRDNFCFLRIFLNLFIIITHGKETAHDIYLLIFDLPLAYLPNERTTTGTLRYLLAYYIYIHSSF
eukprot:gene8023-5578_t